VSPSYHLRVLWFGLAHSKGPNSRCLPSITWGLVTGLSSFQGAQQNRRIPPITWRWKHPVFEKSRFLEFRNGKMDSVEKPTYCNVSDTLRFTYMNEIQQGLTLHSNYPLGICTRRLGDRQRQLAVLGSNSVSAICRHCYTNVQQPGLETGVQACRRVLLRSGALHFEKSYL
jgi:hypothetical protein